MICQLDIEALMRGAIQNRLDGNPVTAGLREGMTVPHNEKLIQHLDLIGQEFAAGLYVVSDDGNTVAISFRLDPDVVQSYQSPKGQTTPFQEANAIQESTLDANAAALEKLIGKNTSLIDRFMDRITSSGYEFIKLMKKSGASAADIEDASRIIEEVKSDPNYKIKVRIMAEYIAQAAAYLDTQLYKAREITRSGNIADRDFVELAEVMEGVKVYGLLIDEYFDVTAGTPNNPLQAIIKKAAADKAEIEAIYSRAATQFSLDTLSEATKEKQARAKAQLEAQIAKLREAAKTPAEKMKVERKIKTLREEAEAKIISETNLEAYLTGNAKDASSLNKFLLAGAMNPDLVVQSFIKKIKDKIQQATRDAKKVGDRLNTAFKQLTDTGYGTTNLDQAFRDLYVDIPHYYYNYDTDTIEVVDIAYFDSEQDQTWRTTHSQLKSAVDQAENRLKQARQNGEPDSVINPLRAALEEAQSTYVAFRRQTFEGEYDDRYQATQELLDTTVTNHDGSTTTLREIREIYYGPIRQLQQVEAIGAVPSDDDMAEISRLRAEFNAVKASDTEVGRLFRQYDEEMKAMTERWEVSPMMQKRFFERKAAVDAAYENSDKGREATEARDRWYAANTTIIYSQNYWEARKQVVEDLNSLASQIRKYTGVQEVDNRETKDLYLDLERIAKKYRDYNGHIDGTKLTVGEQLEIKDIEERLESFKNATRGAYGGFFGAELQRRHDEIQNQIEAEAEELYKLTKLDPASVKFFKTYIANHKENIRKLREQQRGLIGEYLAEVGMDENDVAVVKNMYRNYRGLIKQLSDLTDSTLTHYYYDEYQRRLALHAGALDQSVYDKAMRTGKVKAAGSVYVKSGAFWVESVAGVNTTKVVTEAELRLKIADATFRQTDWYQNNHFKATVFDQGARELVTIDRPIYSWRISKPQDKRFIKKEAPNMSWRRRVVKEEFKNPRRGTQLDGMPTVLESVSRNPDHINNYNRKRASNPALWEFRDKLMREFLDAQQFYPEGKGLGYRVPAIERTNTLVDTLTDPDLNRVKEQFKRSFRITEQDADQGIFAVSDTGGVEKKVVPIKFTGRLASNLTSRNVLELVGKYAGAAQEYKARRELELLSNALETTLSHQSHAPNSEAYDAIGRFKGIRKMLKKRGENHRLDTVRAMTNMMIYGETVSHTSQAGRKYYKILSNMLSLRSFTLFSAFSPTQFMGNLWTQTINSFGGQVQQLIKTSMSSGLAKFTWADYLWAKKEYATNAASFARDTGRVDGRSFWTQFAEFFDTNELAYIDNFGEQVYNRGLFRQLNTSNLAFWKNLVEHELFMTTVMAFARGYKVDTDSGPVPLLDFFDSDISRGFRFKDGMSLSDAQMSDIKGYISALLRDINGNYGKLDRTLVENYWYGKALLFMRKWMIPMFVHRYGANRYSLEQDRFVEGFYVTSAKYLWNDVIRGPFNSGKNLAALFGLYQDPLMTDEQRDALRKTRAEAVLLVGMYAAYALVLGYDDDDEDRFKELKKHSWWYQGLTYSLVKAQSEASTFNPIAGIREAVKLRKNLFSNVVPFLDDIFRIVTTDIDLDADPHFFTRYKRDAGINKKGDMRIVNDLYRLAGRTNAKVDPTEALRAFETNINR